MRERQDDVPIDADVRKLLGRLKEPYLSRCADLVELTDRFCGEHLNVEYRDLCRKLIVAAARKHVPLFQGNPEGWAAAIVYAVGWANFLQDRHQTPHMKSAEIAKGFGVSVATMQAKATTIRKLLCFHAFDPKWTLPTRMDHNPLVWMLTVNGVLMDVRHAPREVQEIAYNKGLIPWIPADRPQEPEEDDE